MVSFNRINGTIFNDVLEGTDDLEARDVIEGLGGDDILRGLAGDDSLDGGEGNDTLIGGAGSDSLNGGLGDDTYIISEDDIGGRFLLERITDIGGNDTLILNFSAGFLDFDITYFPDFSEGARLEIELNGDGVVTIMDQANAADRIETIVFSDGTYDAVQEKFIPLAPLLTTVIGGFTDDILIGGSGDDTVHGLFGNDILDGGFAGNDTLIGGRGEDTYVINVSAQEGAPIETDTIIDTTANNTIRFINLNFADAVIENDNGEMKIFNNGNLLVVANTFTSINKIEFTDGVFDVDRQLFQPFDGPTIINGSDDDDFLLGTENPDVISGFEGNDYIDGEKGDDILNGGEGRDELYGSDGDDELNGGNGDDKLTGNDGDDVLNGGDGDDFLAGDGFFGGDGNDILNGGDGNDILVGDAGLDLLNGGLGIDTYILGEDENFNFGGFDFLGQAIISDDGGYDRLIVSSDDNFSDFIFIQEADGSLVIRQDDGELGAEVVTITDQFTNINKQIERFEFADGVRFFSDGQFVFDNPDPSVQFGTDKDDFIIGTDGNDHIFGEDGSDILDGGFGGNDFLSGGFGGDTYVISRGFEVNTTETDIVLDDGGDFVDSGADFLRFSFDLNFSDVVFEAQLNGDVHINKGDETLVVLKEQSDPNKVIEVVEFSDGAFETTSNIFLPNGELNVINGTDGDDRNFSGDASDLEGTALNDEINGLAGNDRIFGHDGDDVINGGEGDDSLSGDSGDDVLNGGGGNDILFAGSGFDELNGGLGSDSYRVSIGEEFEIFDEGGFDELVLHTSFFVVDEITFDVLDQLDFSTSSDADGNLSVLIDGEEVAKVIDHFNDPEHQIERIEFQDGVFDVGQGEFFRNTLISGGNGRDTLEGTIANDEINADNPSRFSRGSDDIIIASLGDDLIRGSDGVDTLDYRSIEGPIRGMEFGFFPFDLSGNFTDDTFSLIEIPSLLKQDFFNGIEILHATHFDDHIVMGGDGFDASGIETLFAEGGDDFIFGSFFSETIDGGEGDDILNGGIEGRDTLHGGLGNDEYVISEELTSGTYETDTIFDEGGDEDVLRFAFDLNFSDVVISTVAGNLLIEAEGKTLVRINNQDIAENRIEKIIFSDGEFDASIGVFLSDLNVIDGSEDGETLVGTSDDDLINGEGGDDRIVAGAGNDVVNGGAGNDEIRGRDGNDRLNGDDGDDTVVGGEGNDIVHGNDGDDRVFGYAGNDEVFGDAGNDLVRGNDGNDTLHGGDGNDTLNGDAGDDEIFGDAGDDIVIGAAGNDTLHGGDDNDRLFGKIGDDVLFGDAGDDFLFGEEGNDELSGGEGNDTLLGGVGNDELDGGTGDDILHGQDGDDLLFGRAGDDLLRGGLGADQLSGGEGNDTVIGEDGDDIVHGDDGDDRVFGYGGDDEVFGDDGNDLVRGGDGKDTLHGGDGNDTLNGDAGDDTLNGDAGDDILIGAAGNDTLNGGDDNDRLFGKIGDDVLFGDAGDDFLFGEEGNDELNGGEGNDTLLGEDGDDTLNGGAGDDILNGQNGDDLLFGDAGDDVLRGGAGNDTLDGGDGRDTMLGEDGDDILIAGEGYDRMFGGAGADTFKFSEDTLSDDFRETIFDFSIAEGDKLDLSDVLSGFDPLSDAISDFVQIENTETQSFVRLDQAGTGNFGGREFSIRGMSDLPDADTLFANGNLVA